MFTVKLPPATLVTGLAGLVLVIFTWNDPAAASCSALSRTRAPIEAADDVGEKITFTCDGAMAYGPTVTPTPLEVRLVAFRKMS